MRIKKKRKRVEKGGERGEREGKEQSERKGREWDN